METLADLFPPTPRAICVGVNPAPRSVEIGHYYQGNLGQRFFGRLRMAGLLIDPVQGFEDDHLFGKGIGFSDIVKRPTASADLVTVEERKHGAQLLADKLRDAAAPVLICAFKDAAVALIGKFDGERMVARHLRRRAHFRDARPRREQRDCRTDDRVPRTRPSRHVEPAGSPDARGSRSGGAGKGGSGSGRFLIYIFGRAFGHARRERSELACRLRRTLRTRGRRRETRQGGRAAESVLLPLGCGRRDRCRRPSSSDHRRSRVR